MIKRQLRIHTFGPGPGTGRDGRLQLIHFGLDNLHPGVGIGIDDEGAGQLFLKTLQFLLFRAQGATALINTAGFLKRRYNARALLLLPGLVPLQPNQAFLQRGLPVEAVFQVFWQGI